MAKEKLRRMSRFELLQLIYAMKKSNEELTLRCREAEKQLDSLKRETAFQEEKMRRDYELRIDELRMQGAAKDLQQRVKKIEEQIQAFQLTTDQEFAEAGEDPAGMNGTEADMLEPESASPQEDGE